MDNTEKLWRQVKVLALYRQWSDLAYSAGFMNPSSESVREFRKWMRGAKPLDLIERLWDYEKAMLSEYDRQEAEEHEEAEDA